MDNGCVTASNCPDRAELAEFVTGNLPREAFDRVARHVERCGACESSLAVLDDPTHPFLSRLRRAAAEEAASEVPLPPELLAAAQSAYGEGGPADRESVG